jgi:hypothetical protein
MTRAAVFTAVVALALLTAPRRRAAAGVVQVSRGPKARTRTFRRIGFTRGVTVTAPCLPATFRAVFRWTVRVTTAHCK